MQPATQTTFQQYSGTPAEIYEQHFVPAIGRPFALPVVDAADLRPGHRVLDVACGTGVATRIAMNRVGPDGTVAGIDGHPGMLDIARTTEANDPAIEWRQASADDLPFADDAFDAVTCSLGLQFFADKPTAAAEMHRVLDPDGHIAIGVPGPTPPLFEALHDLLASHLGPEVAAFVPVVFSMDDPDTVRALLTKAAFTEIEVDRRSIPLHLDPPAHFFWQYMLGTPLALAVAELDHHQLVELEEAVVSRWEPFATGDGMDIDVGLILGRARGRRE
jgi:SAM-dependent methyltransferase